MYDKELEKNNSIKVQYRVVDVDRSSLCKTHKKFTIFPDRYALRDGTKLCRRFGGKRIDVSSKKKIQEISKWMGTLKSDPEFHENINLDTNTMYSDEEQFNVWKNYETGELPEDPLEWDFAEPNGGLVENCAQLRARRDEKNKWVGTLNDVTCSIPYPVACEGIGVVLLTLRGIFYQNYDHGKAILLS